MRACFAMIKRYVLRAAAEGPFDSAFPDERVRAWTANFPPNAARRMTRLGLMLGAAFHRRRARPHMHGRLLLNPLPLVTAMVHPLHATGTLKGDILHLGPPAPPALDLPARLLVQFAGLLAQPFRADPPRRR